MTLRNPLDKLKNSDCLSLVKLPELRAERERPFSRMDSFAFGNNPAEIIEGRFVSPSSDLATSCRFERLALVTMCDGSAGRIVEIHTLRLGIRTFSIRPHVCRLNDVCGLELLTVDWWCPFDNSCMRACPTCRGLRSCWLG